MIFRSKVTFSVDEYAYDDDSLQPNEKIPSYVPGDIQRAGHFLSLFIRLQFYRYRDDIK